MTRVKGMKKGHRVRSRNIAGSKMKPRGSPYTQAMKPGGRYGGAMGTPLTTFSVSWRPLTKDEFLTKIKIRADMVSRHANEFQQKMIVLLEEIMGKRLAVSNFVGKSRDVYNVGYNIISAPTPMVRTGAFFRSLTQADAPMAIRRIRNQGKNLIFGTTFPFAKILSKGYRYSGPRIRYSRSGRKLLWFNPATKGKFRTGRGKTSTTKFKTNQSKYKVGRTKVRSPSGWQRAYSTSDQGFEIPPRPYLFDDKPMTPDETKKIKDFVKEFWVGKMRRGR